MPLLPAAGRCGRVPLRYCLRCCLRLQRRLRIPWANSGCRELKALVPELPGTVSITNAKQRGRVRRGKTWRGDGRGEAVTEALPRAALSVVGSCVVREGKAASARGAGGATGLLVGGSGPSRLLCGLPGLFCVIRFAYASRLRSVTSSFFTCSDDRRCTCSSRAADQDPPQCQSDDEGQMLSNGSVV